MAKRKLTNDQSAGNAKRQQATQGATHARGGTHRVKDEHLTGTKWDTVNRYFLEQELKSRPGLYKKDLKKHVIAKLLADDDKRIAIAEKRKEKDIQNQRRELQKRKVMEQAELKKKEEERVREKEIREVRRAQGEDISSTSEEEQDDAQRLMGLETFGHFSENEHSETSDQTTTATPSAISPLFPHSMLRIFEWPYPELPSPNPPRSPWSPTTGREREDVTPEIQPHKIPYAVMNLVTILTDETLELPGRTYPEPIGADFVPKLTQYTMNCARNGVMVGTLRKACIETGVEWAKRTKVQWWNGRMYLRLPERKDSRSLADVYAKWDKQKEAKGRGKAPKTGGRVQKINKQKQGCMMKDAKAKMLDIYASSAYRPPICYAPVDLEYPNIHTNDDGPRTLENLYFIRFPGMDLPHYYFWTRPFEWDNPTVPNPAWLSAKIEDEVLKREEAREQDRKSFFAKKGHGVERRIPDLDENKMRVKKKSGSGRRLSKSGKRIPSTSKFEAVVLSIERQLYQEGFARVLHKYRDSWIENGKREHWEFLIDNLPDLCPSSRLPETPPVLKTQDQVPRSLAEKFACIEVPSSSRPMSPIQGDEPWTRDDDQYWDIVDVPSIPQSSPTGRSRSRSRRSSTPRSTKVIEEDIQQELLRGTEPLGLPQVKARRPIDDMSPKNVRDLDAWLNELSPSIAPPTESSVLVTSSGTPFRVFEREQWEKRFELQHQSERASTGLNRQTAPPTSSLRPNKNPAVPRLVSLVEDMPVTELKSHLYTMMNQGSKHKHEEYCRVCLEPLDKNDLKTMHQHYQTHHDETGEMCPFCGLQWRDLNSQWKASHIFSHDFDNSFQRRRSSTPAPLFSIPRTRKPSIQARPLAISTRSQVRHQSPNTTSAQTYARRPSKVHFSPKIVERRIAYNDTYDVNDTGIEADVSSAAMTSPRKSSLKALTKNRKKFKKVELKINTNDQLPHSIGKKKSSAATKRRNGQTTSKGRTGRPADTIYHTPSTPSDHIESPEYHLVRRYPTTHPNAAWNPKHHSTSGEDHITSPYLPHVVKYPREHPEGSYDPRRWSTSAVESLEFHTEKKVLSKKEMGAKGADQASESAAKRRSRRREEKMAEDTKCGDREAPPTAPGDSMPQLVLECGRRHKVIDPTYRDEFPVSSASSYEIPFPSTSRRKGKRKVADPTYHDHPPSPPSSSSRSPILRIPRKPSEPTYRNEPPLSSSSSLKVSTERKKATTKGAQGTKGVSQRLQLGQKVEKPLPDLAPGSDNDIHCSSTVSNASSNSFQRRARALESPELDTIEQPNAAPGRGRKRKATAAASGKSSKKRSGTAGLASELLRGDSAMPEHERWGNDDYIPFVDGPLLKEWNDPLTENLFGTPPKSTKSKPARTKKQTQKEKALELKRAAVAKDFTTLGEAKHSTKRTLSGRPFVEPIVLAPAKRFGKLSPKRRLSISVASTTIKGGDYTHEPIDPPIASPHTLSPNTPKSKKLIFEISARGRRSSAPTPSPSINSLSRSRKSSLASNRSKKSATSPKPSPIAVTTGDKERYSKRHSYDVTFSDTRPIVPPNTPAVTSAKPKGKRQRKASKTETVVADSTSELDVGALSEKMGRVKTTRGGLVRELPETLTIGGLSNGKARGRNIKKKTGVEAEKEVQDKVLSGRVGRRAATKAKPQKEVNGRGKAVLATMAKNTAAEAITESEVRPKTASKRETESEKNESVLKRAATTNAKAKATAAEKKSQTKSLATPTTRAMARGIKSMKSPPTKEPASPKRKATATKGKERVASGRVTKPRKRASMRAITKAKPTVVEFTSIKRLK